MYRDSVDIIISYILCSPVVFNAVNVTETAQGENTALLNIANDIAEPRPCVPMDRTRTRFWFRSFNDLSGFLFANIVPCLEPNLATLL